MQDSRTIVSHNLSLVSATNSSNQQNSITEAPAAVFPPLHLQFYLMRPRSIDECFTVVSGCARLSSTRHQTILSRHQIYLKCWMYDLQYLRMKSSLMRKFWKETMRLIRNVKQFNACFISASTDQYSLSTKYIVIYFLWSQHTWWKRVVCRELLSGYWSYNDGHLKIINHHQLSTKILHSTPTCYGEDDQENANNPNYLGPQFFAWRT